jgi:TolB-like protein
VSGSGEPLTLRTRKDKLLLAYLALSAGRAQTRDRLADLLWGDRAETQARDSLKQSLAGLRQVFREVGLDPFESDRESVTFQPAGLEIDAVEFARLATEATASEKLVALYRGDLLEGIEGKSNAFEDWLRPERERLSDLAVRVLEQLALSAAPNCTADEMSRLGRQLLARDHLREPVYRALMRLHARKGERTEALKLYTACRNALKQDLGVAPDAKTEELYRDILTDSPSSQSGVEPTPARPSVAVLPFTNLSGDPSQTYLSDGITEDIITELSRFRSLFVIARNSSFVYRGESTDVRRIGRELGVRFVVEGSFRRLGEHLRITAQLIEAVTGNHVWGERYDRHISDLFAVQDEVARTIVATLAGRLEDAELRTAVRKPTDSLQAYDCLLRGIEHLRGYADNDNRLAIELFERAIALDPRFALAHAYLALTLLVEHGFGDAPDVIKDRVLDTALTAMRLDPNESRCHWFLAQAYLYRGEFEQAMSHFDRSVVLNPNDANCIASKGLAVAFVGRAEEGIGLIRQAMRLNPYHPDWYWSDLAIALYAARRYEEALETNRLMSDRKSYWYLARLAACYAQLGRLDEARVQAAEVLRLKPDFRLTRITLHYKNPQDAEHVFEGMRKAGLPE